MFLVNCSKIGKLKMNEMKKMNKTGEIDQTGVTLRVTILQESYVL